MSDKLNPSPTQKNSFEQYRALVLRAINMHTQINALINIRKDASRAKSANWSCELKTAGGLIGLKLDRDSESGLDRILVSFAPPPPTFNEFISKAQSVTVSRRIESNRPDLGSMAFIVLDGVTSTTAAKSSPVDSIHVLSQEVAASLLPNRSPS